MSCGSGGCVSGGCAISASPSAGGCGTGGGCSTGNCGTDSWDGSTRDVVGVKIGNHRTLACIYSRSNSVSKACSSQVKMAALGQ